MMKKYFFILLLLALAGNVRSQEITGPWNGTLEIQGATLRVQFNISESGDGYAATMDSPDQGAFGIPITSTVYGKGKLAIRSDELQMSYEGVLLGKKITGTFEQMGLRAMLDLYRGAVELSRPQTPKPPYPYKSEELTFPNPEVGINLAGTLTYPAEGDQFPAVVLITGSGAQNRDEEVFGHKPFLVIADYLTRHGIAVLRYDDRGYALSEGNYSEATTHDFATDARAAVDYLRSRPEIDNSRIGLLGHSEGGTIAFIVAAGSDDIAFIVSLAGSAVNGGILAKEQRRLIGEASGTPAHLIEENEQLLENISAAIAENSAEEFLADPMKYMEGRIPPSIEAMMADEPTRSHIINEIREMGQPWIVNFMNYDPAGDLARITCPVLALNGEKDLQVPAEMNFEAMEKYIDSELTTKKYPGLNHLFQHAGTGLIQEYIQIEETMSPEVLEDIANWITKAVSRP